MLILVMILILALAILVLVGVTAPPVAPQTARYAVLFMAAAVFVATLLGMIGVLPALTR